MVGPLRDELLDEIEGLFAAALARVAGVAVAKAADAARDFRREFVERFGGALLYLPLDRRRKAAEKAAAIVAEFKGNNHNELAVRHALSASQVYRILRRNMAKGSK